MTIKLTNKLEKGNHIVTLTAGNKQWKDALEKSKKDLLANLQIKGFRKGKVPTNIAEQYVKNDAVQGKAAEIIIDKNYSKVIDLLQKEQIISRPAIELVKISDTEVEVTFTSAVYPEVKLGKTSGFKAELKETKATKEEVEKEIERLSQHFKTSKAISEDRAVKDGDVVNIDFKGMKDGVAFDGGTAEGYDLKIGSNSFIPGFEAQVEGMKKGETKDIELTFPETYPQKDLAGKDVVFEVKVNEIKEEVMLKGEELEKNLKLMGFKSEADMKEKIEYMLNDQKLAQANDDFFNQVVIEIEEDKATEMDIPEQLITDEVENQFKTFEQQLSKQGMTMDKYLEMMKKSKEEFKNEHLKDSALSRIKHGLIYTQLIKDLKVEVTDEMIKEEMKKISDMQGVDVKELEKNMNIESFKNALLFQELIKELKK